MNSLKDRFIGRYSLFFLALTVYGIIYRITWNAGIPDVYGSTAGLAALIVIAVLSKASLSIDAGRKKMSFKAFICFFGLFCFAVLVATPVYDLIEKIFNSFGLTMFGSSEVLEESEASIQAPAMLVLLYPVFIGPVYEEFMYRLYGGKLISQGKGRFFAIFATALAFSIGHGRFSFFVHTFIGGLVLATIMCEYGFIWACIFHIINNFGISLIGMLLASIPEYGDLAFTVFKSLLAVIALVICYVSRDRISGFVKENAFEKGAFRDVFCNIGFLIFLAFNIYKAVTAVVPM